jgi:hypothetical protein
MNRGDLSEIMKIKSEADILAVLPISYFEDVYGHLINLTEACSRLRIPEGTLSRYLEEKYIYPMNFKIRKRKYFTADQFRKVVVQLSSVGRGQHVNEWLGDVE